MEQQNLRQFLLDSAEHLGLEPAVALREIPAETGVREEADDEQTADVSLGWLCGPIDGASGLNLCGGVA